MEATTKGRGLDSGRSPNEKEPWQKTNHVLPSSQLAEN
jgi:hypothetical protein